MKIVNSKIIQILLVLFIFSSISLILTSSMSFGLLKKTNKKNDAHIPKSTNIEKSKKYIEYNDSQKKNVYFEGWIKYLHYTESEKTKPKAFFKNINFAHQEKNPNMKKFKGKDKVIKIIK